MVVQGKLRARLDRLDQPVDGASLVAFRVAFGCLMFVAAARFFAHGWIDADYRAPRVFFPYWGLGWVRPWPYPWMHVHYGAMAASAVAIAAGFLYRPACVAFALLFTYAHLCDRSNYLNHYYLVSLVAALLALVPLDRDGSVRVWHDPSARRPLVRTWMLWLLRFQVGLVYVFGGLGKLTPDWLLRAEPLRIWLAANRELPVLGSLWVRRETAVAFSLAGAAFDLAIVPLLLHRRTRAPAYALVVGFHVTTALLFPIGMFPWIMMAAATLMFDPSWPRRLLGRWWPAPGREPVAGPALTPRTRLAGAVYVAVQLAMPLRSLLYPGNTLWTEEGFRFAWKVMLIEKSGALELTVVDRQGRRFLVEPRDYLTPLQARMVATQPDMILQFAHLVAADFDRRGAGPVQVFADAQVSFNGRARAPLIAPDVDLASEHDGLAPKGWILPAPTGEPLF